MWCGLPLYLVTINNYHRMARKPKNTVEYFPFICEDGNKMFYIEETYGNDGFATFVKLLRELAKKEYHYLDLSHKTTLMYLAAKCKVSKEVLEAIINDLVDLGKFNSILWNENKIIWCQDFIDSIQDAYIKRNNKCMTLDGLFTLLDSLGVRKLSKSTLKGTGNTQTILKYTKEKENKVNDIEERKLKFADTLKPFLSVYGKDMIFDFYCYWTEPNKSNTKFKQELQKTWDTKRRLQTWCDNDSKFGNKSKGKEPRHEYTYNFDAGGTEKNKFTESEHLAYLAKYKNAKLVYKSKSEVESD